MLLAIDTSTRQAGLALYDGARGLLAEYTWHSANRHTEELMPATARLLTQAGGTARDLAAVGIAIGPGSFTGLRVGLAAAKGLALANGVALVSVPTLDFTAYPHQAQPAPVVAVLPAGRGRVYWAPYAHGPAGWGPQAAYALSTLLELANTIVRPTLIAGEIAAADQQALERSAGSGWIRFLPPALGLRRPGYLAEMAWQRFIAGHSDDPSALSPIYLRSPEGTGDR